MSNVKTQKQKRQLFYLRSGRSCPIGEVHRGERFNAIFVYSYLVYRLTMKDGDVATASVSRETIRRGTGLDTSRSIPTALRVLENHNLIGYVGNKIHAVEPEDLNWFVVMQNTESRSWYERISYCSVQIPARNHPSGLSARQNVLYWMITSKPRQAQKWYELTLGITPATCRSAIRALRRLNLLSPNELVAIKPNEQQMSLWQDSYKITKKVPNTDSEWRLSSFCSEFEALWFFTDAELSDGTPISGRDYFIQRMDQYEKRLRQAGYTAADMSEYCQQLQATELTGYVELLFLRGFDDVFELAESETRQNQRTGKFHGRNSLGFLKKYTASALLQIEELHQRNADMLFAWEFQKGDD